MGYAESPPREGGGRRSTPSVFSRGGTLLPSSYADARCVDAVIRSLARSVLTRALEPTHAGYVYTGRIDFSSLQVH